MGTHSSIAVKMSDGTVKQVYCHWDGYKEGVGQMLKNHYATQDSAEAMVILGDMSQLCKYIVPIGFHSYDEPEAGVSVYYGRDRGESGVSTIEFQNLDTFLTDAEMLEYNYLFNDGCWTCKTSDDDAFVSY